MQFPLVAIEQNLIMNDRREIWAVYRIQPWHYEHVSAATRLSMLWRLTRMFWDLEDCAGQLLMVPRTHSIGQHLQAMKQNVQGPLATVAANYCDDAQAQLKGIREGVEYEHYLALRLPQAAAEAAGPSFLKSLWQEPARFFEETLGLRAPRLLDHELDGYLQREEAIFGRLARVVQASRVEAHEIAWLIQRGFWRGIGDPPARQGWAPDTLASPGPNGAVELRPEQSELRTLTEGEMDLRHPRRVAITQVVDGQGEVTGLQTFCCIAYLPDELTFPGSEWLYRLEDLPFPVEVCLRWHAMSHEKALAVVRRKKLDIGDQVEHTNRSGEEVPIVLSDAQEQATALEYDLKQRRFPTILSSIYLVISAVDERVLLERVQQVRSHFTTFQMGVEVPAGDQLGAFLACVPGNAAGISDYTHRVPPEVLAGSMFLGTRALGDGTGPYIGRSGMLRRPIYLDPALPPQLNRSGSIAFLGSLGGGKSFTANLLTYLAVVMGGAQALVLDPKGERTNWLRELPELAGHLQVVTLGSSSADAGKLDPFIMGRGLSGEDLRETGNLAISLLSFMANIQTGNRLFLALMQAVERVVDQPEPALGKVVDELEQMGQNDSEIATLGAYYRALSRLAYANLIFGRGHEQGLDLVHRLNVLQLQHLTMPPAGKPREEFSLEELLSVALMHAVTGFATRFTQRDRGTFKIVLLDEAWALTASSQGRTLVSQLLRTGRAMNNAVYLVSQNVADLLDETIRNNIGAKFIFRSFDQQEISNVLQFLGLEAEAENIQALRQLETGQALFQDLQGRVGVVTVDAVFPHLAKAFDTRPQARKEEAVR